MKSTFQKNFIDNQLLEILRACDCGRVGRLGHMFIVFLKDLKLITNYIKVQVKLFGTKP